MGNILTNAPRCTPEPRSCSKCETELPSTTESSLETFKMMRRVGLLQNCLSVWRQLCPVRSAQSRVVWNENVQLRLLFINLWLLCEYVLFLITACFVASIRPFLCTISHQPYRHSKVSCRGETRAHALQRNASPSIVLSSVCLQDVHTLQKSTLKINMQKMQPCI